MPGLYIIHFFNPCIFPSQVVNVLELPQTKEGDPVYPTKESLGELWKTESSLSTGSKF